MKRIGLCVIGLILISVLSIYASGGQTAGQPAAAVPTIRILMPGNIQSFFEGEDVNKNDIHSYMEKISGYKLVYSILPTQNANERLTLEMASGNPADVVVYNNRDLFLQYINEGYLTVLNDYIAKSSVQWVPEMMDPNLRQMGTVDNKQYAIVTPAASRGNADFMSGLKSLTAPLGNTDMTLDGIQRMFAAAKRAYPDKIILTGAGGSTVNYKIGGLGWLYGAFGVASAWRENGGRLEYSPVTNDMRSLLEYIAGLNAAGYLDPEYAVLRTERVQEKIAQGNVVFANLGQWDWAGMSTAHWLPAVNNPLWSHYGNVIGSSNRSGQMISNYSDKYCMIPVTSKVPQEAVNFINHCLQYDTMDFLNYGQKGRDWHFDNQGDYIIDTQLRYVTGQQYYVYYLYLYTSDMRVKRLRSSIPTVTSEIAYVYKELIPHNEALLNVQNPIASMPPVRQYLDRIQDIDDLCAEYFLKIAVGALPVSAFNEFLTRFNAIGGNEMVNAVNQWYTSTRR